jgi:hypothetical protein
MGQIGDAVGGALGGMGGQQQTMPYQPGGFGGNMGGDMGGGEYSPNPMGGLERPQVGYDGGNMLSNMGNNTRLGNNTGQQQTMPYQPGGFGLGSAVQQGNFNPFAPVSPDVRDFVSSVLQGPRGNYDGRNSMTAPAIGMPGGQGGQTTYGNIARPPAQSYDQYLAGRSPMQQDVQLTQDQFQRQNQMGSMMGQQQAMQQAQAMQQQGGMGQQPMGLAGLLGGMPNQPTPTAPPVSTTQPAPMAQPAPVAARPAPVAAKPLARPAPTRAAPAKPSIMGSRPAAKPMAKPSVVPPKTPPAVASAIQKLAAKKQNRR